MQMRRDYTRSKGGRSVLRQFEEVNRSGVMSLSDAGITQAETV
jgi:hypothetical protein